MSRIFFDTMLFVYLLEDNRQFSGKVREILQRCYERGDLLQTSYLALGEVLAGGKDEQVKETMESAIREMGVSFVPFDESCVPIFSKLRSETRLRAPDAIHLSCAASAATDLFLTNDAQLLQRRLHVPGIQFIAGFNQSIL